MSIDSRDSYVRGRRAAGLGRAGALLIEAECFPESALSIEEGISGVLVATQKILSSRKLTREAAGMMLEAPDAVRADESELPTSRFQRITELNERVTQVVRYDSQFNTDDIFIAPSEVFEYFKEQSPKVDSCVKFSAKYLVNVVAACAIANDVQFEPLIPEYLRRIGES